MRAYLRPATQAASLFCCALAVVSLPACGLEGSFGTVTGTIKHQGQVITRGLITFVGEKGEPKSCAIIEGKYESGPIPIGPYKIMIALNDLPIPGAPPAKVGVVGEGLGPADGKAVPKTTPTPKVAKKLTLNTKYGDPDSSGLSMTVAGGSNTFDANLD